MIYIAIKLSYQKYDKKEYLAKTPQKTFSVFLD